MKKLLSIALILIFSMSVFTGCVKNDDSQSQSQSSSSVTTSSSQTLSRSEENPNYETVLLKWNDLDGYWVSAGGDYMHFTLAEDGKTAVFYIYDKEGKLTGYAVADAVMASSKSADMLECTYPKVSGDEKLPGLEQEKKTRKYSLETGGTDKKYIILSEKEGEYERLAFAGKTQAEFEKNLSSAIKTAKTLK